MKFLLFLFFIPVFVQAQQGISINTDSSTPHSSAMVDVKSTNKGLLLPRMTQFQRLALTPVNGLLVYETTSDRLYQYQNGAWRFFIDNSYWGKHPVRGWLYNTVDSVGIGNAAPTEKLHLSNGNFRILNGDIKMDLGDIIMNKPDGIIQLQASGEDKGFVQLSGDDLRLGTNSSNANGKLVIRTQGANQASINGDGILIANNAKITKNEAGSFNLLPVCYGSVDANGAIINGTSNFSISKEGPGHYAVIVDNIIAKEGVIIVTPRFSVTHVSVGEFFGGVGGAENIFAVRTFPDRSTIELDAAFNFMVFVK